MDAILYPYSSHLQLPTSISSSPVNKLFSLPQAINMVRSSSSELARAPKRKGTRSVSTLTPAQLARKRANDREAQRAIRARTKEHIERLEQEVDELKKAQSQSSDERIRDLVRRNQALEAELRSLRDMGYHSGAAHRDAHPPTSIPMGQSMHSYRNVVAPSYEENVSTGNNGITSQRASPFSNGEYAPADSYHHPSTTNSFSVPGMSHTHSHHGQHITSSSVSSPCSSCANTDSEYITAGGPAPYIPTSMPSTMQQQQHSTPTSHHLMPSGPIGDKIQPEVVMTPPYPPHQPQGQGSQQNPQNWGVYNVYYPQQQIQSPVH